MAKLPPTFTSFATIICTVHFDYLADSDRYTLNASDKKVVQSVRERMQFEQSVEGQQRVQPAPKKPKKMTPPAKEETKKKQPPKKKKQRKK